jgi:hypothetical protein
MLHIFALLGAFHRELEDFGFGPGVQVVLAGAATEARRFYIHVNTTFFSGHTLWSWPSWHRCLASVTGFNWRAGMDVPDIYILYIDGNE